jgi:hypothetical protein
MPSGYSGKQTWQKLGITPGQSATVLGLADDYTQTIGGLPDGVKVARTLRGSPEFVHLFVTKRREMDKQLRTLRDRIQQNGTVWVSWPKKSAKVDTDITEDVIREVALPLGFVDVKVCAVNEVWSGLKLVIRKELRAR